MRIKKRYKKGVVRIIKVTRMDGEEIVVNVNLIETVRATPDTIINLTSGKKLLVKDEVDDIISKSMSYYREIIGGRGVK